MTKARAEHVLDDARVFRERGWVPVPVQFKQKRPPKEAGDWTKFEPNDNALVRWFGDGLTNIGVLLGERSGYLTDIDLDCPEARALALSFLPPTDLRHGRQGAPASHYWFVTGPPGDTRKYQDPTDGTMLVELRANGAMTIVPPSIHPDGEQIEWDTSGSPPTVSYAELLAAVRRLAAASLLARHWPQRGGRHHAAMALSGLLIRGGWEEPEMTSASLLGPVRFRSKGRVHSK